MMFRRKFLRTAGTTITLPFLQSMRARAASPPRRFLTYYVPNGVHIPAWMPRGTGTAYALSPTLQPLAPVRNDVLVLTGLTNAPGVAVPAGGAHGIGAAGMLTCRRFDKKTGKIELGKSVDQMMADVVGKQTQLPSLEIGLPDTVECEPIPCVLQESISWRGPSTPASVIRSPKQAFDRLFQGFDPAASTVEVARRAAYRKSVFDHVLADVKALQAFLSAPDQAKLDEYATSVRDVERRIQHAPMTESRTCKAAPLPPASEQDFPAQVGLMHEIIALAFRCDITRVITFAMGNALGTRSYAFIGAPGNSHALSHHSNVQTAIDAVKKIDRWRIEQFVKLIQRLQGMQDAEGKSVLFNSALYYTSEVADGNKHDQHNKPILVAGQMGGAFKTGRLIEFPAGANGSFRRCDEFVMDGCNGTPVANLHMTFLRAMGETVNRFGDNGAGLLDLG